MVLITKDFHIDRTAKGHTSSSRQSSHSMPTPRIGGLGIIAFAIVSLGFGPNQYASSSIALVISAFPVFLGGLGEDVGREIKPTTRLMLSFFSAALAILLLDTWLTHSGVPFLDNLLSISAISLLVTVLISGGVCHSLNLVDGLNGLAIGLALIALTGIVLIALSVGDQEIAYISLILISSIAGILVFNFPTGRIFLGDAGAYTLGHLLCWLALLLLARNPEVTPFSCLLLLFWPVSEMLFSILRRLYKRKPIDQPDRMHFHQFVMRSIEITFSKRRAVANPLATTAILPLAALPALLGVLLYDKGTTTAMTWLTCFITFILIYVFGIVSTLKLARKGTCASRVQGFKVEKSRPN